MLGADLPDMSGIEPSVRRERVSQRRQSSRVSLGPVGHNHRNGFLPLVENRLGKILVDASLGKVGRGRVTVHRGKLSRETDWREKCRSEVDERSELVDYEREEMERSALSKGAGDARAKSRDSLESAPRPANMLYATRNPSLPSAPPLAGVNSDLKNSITTSVQQSVSTQLEMMKA